MDRNKYYAEDDKSRSPGEIKSDVDSPDTSRRRAKKKKSHRKERRRSSVSSDGRSNRDLKDDRRHRRRHHHRRSSSRSRSRSKSMDKRRRHKRYHRSRSRSSDSINSAHSWGSSEYGSRWDDKPTDSYKYQSPNNTVMIRGLAPHLTENDIRQDLLKCGILVKDIRLIRHRETGSSRGFAFVEFHTVSDAIRWMEAKKGVLLLHDQFESNLIYSVPKVGNMDSHLSKFATDWYCGKCRAYNFKRRELCYKCSEPRPPDEDAEISNEISSSPTNTIMLFALDALTTEDTVLQAFQSKPALASLPIRSVRIARESGTNLSKGICYVESNNIADAMRLFSVFTREAMEIDNRKVQAAYYKIPTVSPSKNTAAALALAAAQWTNNCGTDPPIVVPDDKNDIEKMAEYSASLYAKTKEEHASYVEYYREYYRNEAKQNRDKETVAKSSLEVSCASTINKRVELAASGPQSAVNWTDSEVPEAPDGMLDKNRCQFDESSGYYYYPDSGYYYDPNTQHYYDPETQQFLQWDPELKQHRVVTSGPLSATDSEKLDKDSEKRNKTKKSQGFPDKVRVAKNVAKNMEKWAKNFNQKKEFSRYGAEPEVTQGFGKWSTIESTSEASTSQSKFTSNDSTTIESTEPEFEDIPIVENDGCNSIVPENEDSNPDPTDARFIDMQKIACLLCKRQFSSAEVLIKHANMSDLHKQNLSMALGRQNMDSPIGSQTGKTYRDRAKERRMRFGTQADVASNSLKDLYMKVKKDITTTYVEEPTKQGIKQDNIGNRMLQKMGWLEGQGLGKDNRGIIDPITAERRIGKHGLGLDIPGGDVEESDDRQTKARKLTLARYMKLD